MPAARRTDDDGVSSVVSAVLVFGLFVTASTMYTLQTLPQWIADKEENHLELVQQRFDALKAGVDGAAATGSTATVSAAIPLSPAKVPMLQRTAAPGALRFVPGLAAYVNFTSQPAIFASGGAPAATPTAAITGTPIQSIRQVGSLLVAMSTAAVTGAASGYVQAQASDGSSTITLVVRHLGTGTSCSSGAGVQSELSGTGLTTVTTPLLCGVGNGLTSYQVNLLDEPRFAGGLSRLATPFNLTLSSGGAVTAATYAMTWIDANGTDRLAGTGLAQWYNVTQSGGGAIQYSALTQQYPQQTLSYEFGGLVRHQNDGQAVVNAPAFQLSGNGTVGNLRWTLVRTTASAGSSTVSGAGHATAAVTPQSSNEVLLTATAGTATLSLVTPEARGWGSYLNDTLLLAGLSGCPVTASATGLSWPLAACTLTANGATTTLSSWVLHLTLVDAQATVS